MEKKARVIAFYLPQFYSTPENDKWWGKGFTEWTNVGKAKPLFPGHYQPKVPSQLGYYNLRLASVREAQARMARESGIEGFCYWHYWFSGKRLLDTVFNEVLDSGEPDFPFCLCWANHSWYAKTWRSDIKDKLLIEQTYPGTEDYINHFNAVLPAFKDKRYIKVGNKPVFGLYSALDIPDLKSFVNMWNELAFNNGFDGIYFVAFSYDPKEIKKILSYGVNRVIIDYIKEAFENMGFVEKVMQRFFRRVMGIPKHISYNRYAKIFLNDYSLIREQIPCILPNFDHTPRSGSYGLVLVDSTPQKWFNLVKKVLTIIQSNKNENFVFIKAWNEWAEGNYLEPDIKYGNEYLKKLKDAIFT